MRVSPGEVLSLPTGRSNPGGHWGRALGRLQPLPRLTWRSLGAGDVRGGRHHAGCSRQVARRRQCRLVVQSPEFLEDRVYGPSQKRLPPTLSCALLSQRPGKGPLQAAHAPCPVAGNLVAGPAPCLELPQQRREPGCSCLVKEPPKPAV